MPEHYKRRQADRVKRLGFQVNLCMLLSKLFYFSGPQFPYLYKKIKKFPYLQKNAFA